MENKHKTVVISRLMRPNDANGYGNVHGGTILDMIEEVGGIIATRFCNNPPEDCLESQNAKKARADEAQDKVAVLARIEHMDFIQPMHIGEVSDLVAELKYTAPHSMLVEVSVWAENIIKGTKRKTNTAHLWYVPLLTLETDTVTSVPQMKYSTSEEEECGKKKYDWQKQQRRENVEKMDITLNRSVFTESNAGLEPHTVGYSRTCLSHLVGVNDVTQSGHSRGGYLLKIMDECAGITAAKHCHMMAVTACLSATNFHKKVHKGDVVAMYGYVTFTSSRSMEVEVIVEYESIKRSGTSVQRAVDAFFTYVAIDKDEKSMAIPQLKVHTEEEKLRFEEGRKRYEYRKEQREMERRGQN